MAEELAKARQSLFAAEDIKKASTERAVLYLSAARAFHKTAARCGDHETAFRLGQLAVSCANMALAVSPQCSNTILRKPAPVPPPPPHGEEDLCSFFSRLDSFTRCRSPDPLSLDEASSYVLYPPPPPSAAAAAAAAGHPASLETMAAQHQSLLLELSHFRRDVDDRLQQLVEWKTRRLLERQHQLEAVVRALLLKQAGGLKGT